ncbi:MAG: RecX family transcriptional regulator [Alphaproteobacteria bacterium]|nr:RecX family transcriptional regulator [Alphaproteobacteria bacterium]
MADRTSSKESASAGKQKPERKVPRRITKERLRNIALYHLQRFATSSENLRRVLYRRTLKAARHHETDMDQARAWIDDVVGALIRSAAIDDSRYADGKTLTLLRRGQSLRKIRAYLASKGVDGETINAALERATEEVGDPDLEAARAYAMRRRLGPFRTKGLSSEAKQKELAALGRAGFRYEIARKIVEAETEDDLM